MFEFSAENKKKMATILSKYPKDRSTSAIMPLLWLAQEQGGENILDKDKIAHVSEILNIPVIKVYEVASFYTMYNLNPVGKNHIQICGTVPCYFMGAKDIIKSCEKIFGVSKNKLTEDGSVSFTEVECLGACANAPVIQINNKDYKVNIAKDEIIPILSKIVGM